MEKTINKLQISVPSKTFLLGEYLVLHGGPGIVLTTAPRFKLIVEKTNNKTKNVCQGINKESPAGKLVQKYLDLFTGYHLTFIDPYNGVGGFGASSAQFVMIEALKQAINNLELTDSGLLSEYSALSWNGKGVPPSGVDLIAQVHGGLCYFYKKKGTLTTFSWVFSDLAYFLLHTGIKLATHEHLNQLTTIPDDELEKTVFSGITALQNSDEALFLSSITAYAHLLQKNNLVAEHTQVLLNELHSNSFVLAAKGCGALGADVIVALVKKKDINDMLSWVKKQKLHLIHYGDEIENGLQLNETEIKT